MRMRSGGTCDTSCGCGWLWCRISSASYCILSFAIRCPLLAPDAAQTSCWLSPSARSAAPPYTLIAPSVESRSSRNGRTVRSAGYALSGRTQARQRSRRWLPDAAVEIGSPPLLEDIRKAQGTSVAKARRSRVAVFRTPVWIDERLRQIMLGRDPLPDASARPNTD
jgi:hypothetical protein